MDILAMTNYLVFSILRQSGLFNSFFWLYKDSYLANWCFNQTFLSVLLRCFGVLVISFQRYVSLCEHGHLIEQIINSSHRWILPVLQWVVPTVYSIPLLLFSNATFVSSQNMEVLSERQSITIATSMTAFFVFITFLLCSLCYGTILRFLIKNRKSSSVFRLKMPSSCTNIRLVQH
ncbi:hypothetical protein COOONC_26136 [Cooperia oncophora]